MNWTEQFRPKRIEEMIGQHKFVEDATKWVERKRMPNLFLHGVPGTGKTSAAFVLASNILGEDFKTNFLEINASQDRRLETVRETITNFVTTRSISSNRKKFILLDEIEGMTRDAQRALKRTMERAIDTTFIITCNDSYAVDDALKSRCANYIFTHLPHEIQVERLVEMLEKIGIPPAQETVEKIVENCSGDFRRAINELQACIYSDSDVSELIGNTTRHYKNSIRKLLDGDPEGMTYLNTLIKNGQSVKDICNKLLQSVMDMDMDNTQRFMCIATVGEMEWRSKSVTPKVLIAWFSSQLINTKGK